jgi:tight adherence protein B
MPPDPAALMAATAAACGVAAAWDLFTLMEGAAPRRLLAPLLATGMQGPSAGERRRLAIVAAGSLLAAGWLMFGLLPGVVLAAAGPAIVGKAIAWRRGRWRAELAGGAGTAARALADALAGGHSVRGAIGEAGMGLPGAVGEELRRATRRLALGERTDAVLADLRARARDHSWDAIVAAIALQRTSGGDLARLLRDLAHAIEERLRTEADAHAATAQARMTAWIVAALPAGAAAIAELADPSTLRTLFATGPSSALAIAAFVCEISGVLVVRAVVRKAGRW